MLFQIVCCIPPLHLPSPPAQDVSYFQPLGDPLQPVGDVVDQSSVDFDDVFGDVINITQGTSDLVRRGMYLLLYLFHQS